MYSLCTAEALIQSASQYCTDIHFEQHTVYSLVGHRTRGNALACELKQSAGMPICLKKSTPYLNKGCTSWLFSIYCYCLHTNIFKSPFTVRKKKRRNHHDKKMTIILHIQYTVKWPWCEPLLSALMWTQPFSNACAEHVNIVPSVLCS